MLMGATTYRLVSEIVATPIFADLPDLDLRLVLLDHRVAERPGDGRG